MDESEIVHRMLDVVPLWTYHELPDRHTIYDQVQDVSM